MKRIIAMLVVTALMLGFVPAGVSAYAIPPIRKIEDEKPGIVVNTQSRTSGFSTNYTLTGDGAADMVAIALAQEGRTGSEFGYTEEWCADFVSDCAILAGQSAAVPQYGVVGGLYSRIISAGGTVTTGSPKPGDICFINWSGGTSKDHVEIVYAVSGTTVYTIGGNSGSGTSLRSRKVTKHAPLDSSYVVSIVRPAYSGHATATLDINGYLDGADQGTLSNYGTFDVWVNGSLVADNVNDYCADLTVGASYEITDIQAAGIHKYLGLREGSLSGTIGSVGNTVRLQFRTLDSIGDDFYAYIINKNTSRTIINQGDFNACSHTMIDNVAVIWHFDRLEDGTYKITSVDNDRSLDVQSYGTTAGTNVITMPYTGNTAQRWCIFEENGWCTLSAVCTPCVLYEDSATTNIQMMNDTGSDAQWFNIYKIPATYAYDVNANINGTEVGSAENYGTFDVWINGEQAADNVTDFAQSLSIGSTYEIRDIKAVNGRSYNGITGGSQSGRIHASNARTVLSFSDSISAPTGEAELNGRKYVYYPSQVTWYTAKEFCEELGGHLVTITSEEENELVNSLCADLIDFTAWIGANDAADEGNWEWITGESFDYQNWRTSTSEPNNTTSNDEGCENYVVFEDDGWNDNPGNAIHPFICEFDETSTFTFSVDALINGTESDTAEDYGTFDVWLNGELAADDVADFAQAIAMGTTYEIRDIKACDGCSYNGVANGSIYGTISNSPIRTMLNFSDVQFDAIGAPAAEIEKNGRKYAYYADQVTWYTARAFCEEMGGHLVTITGEEESNLVISLSAGAEAWIGATDMANEGTWEWITGEPFDYTYWWPDEPNNTPSRYDLSENYAYSTDGGWNDIYGCAQYGFVLEIDPPAVLAQGYSGSTTWVLTEDGVLTFSGSGKMRDYEYKSEMPWYAYADQITSVVLEEGVTSIGDYAFYGMPIESIAIADSVTTIGAYAFKGCTALNSVVLPNGLTKLGESAFYGCTALTAIEIPASLYTVQPYTFKNCTSLASVTFNEGNLQKISDGAFYNTALTELVLPDCLTILDVYSFKNCSKLASITLSSSMTQIREAAFYGTAIATIAIPEGVTSVGPYAFKNCTKLVSIDLPSTLTSIGEASFYACTALESLEVPDAVTKIDNYAFRKCAAMTSVTFGAELVTIGESSFYGCESLVFLNIPAKVTTIQGYAFKGCTGLELVNLPGSLISLGDSAFHSCTGLDEITISAGVAKIGEYCFSGSTGIDYIYFLGDAPSIGTGAFNKLNAAAYYPSDNSTWTDSVKQNYGGTITWTAQ